MAAAPPTRLALAVAALLAGGCSADTADLSPLQWTKDGVVLGLGQAGAFDERGAFTVSAFRDGGVVRLYYGGADTFGSCPGINSAHWRVGLATSTDGVTFARVPGGQTGGSVLDVGAAGQFDEYLTYRPFVLKDVDAQGQPIYRMWYNGSRKPFLDCTTNPATPALDRRIGYAQSGDGVSWTRLAGPAPDGSVLPLGGPAAIDGQQVGYVWVLKDGAQYKMYYSANDLTNTWRVGLAVSDDALTWTKVPGKLDRGAILDIGLAGSFDQGCAYQPTVVKEHDRLYRMWYRGCELGGVGPNRGTIGYAESNDGITWFKIPQPGPGGAALGKGAPGAFDDTGLTTPSVFLGSDGWSLYYAGFDSSLVFQVGLARAARR